MLRFDNNLEIWESGDGDWARRIRTSGLLLLISLVLASRCLAQEAPAGAEPGKSIPSEAPQAGSEEHPPVKSAPVVPRIKGPLPPSGPDTYLLLDSEGRPQPMLGMTYEDFFETWKKLHELEQAAAEPAYEINTLSGEGKLDGDTAVIDIRMEIEVREEGPLEVPLGFAGAILREIDKSRESHQLSYDAQRGGYQAWIRGTAPQTVIVNLPLLVPLKREGDRIALRTNVPRALVNQLVLETPQRVTSPVISEGAIVRLSDRGAGSLMTLSGIVGDVVLSWQTSNSEAVPLETVLSVQGHIATSVDGRGARSEARLRVESFGGKFQQFQLRLPPGAKLIPQDPTELSEIPLAYKLIPVSDPAAPTVNNGKETGQIYDVRFSEPTAGPVDVELTTEQAIGLSEKDSLTELAGFEVLGAVRQFGKLTVRVDSDWQLRWSHLAGGRQISTDELTEDAAEGAGLFAFEYYQQPWSLPVEIGRRDSRVAVAPKYQLKILPEEARLKVALQYQLAGSKETKFWVDLAGWHITSDPIEPTRMINVDDTREVYADQLLLRFEDILQERDARNNSENTFLELSLNQPASRRTEITFQLRRPLKTLEGHLQLPLPTPLADSIGTGELIVVTDPGLLVTPDSAQAEGLAARPLMNEAEASTDTALVPIATYRTFLDRLVFSADVKVRPGEVQATIDSKIALDSRRAQVEHVLGFNALYRPLHELELLVPASLWRDPLLRLTILSGDGKTSADPTDEGVQLDIRASASDESFGLPTELVTVALPQPRLGRFRLRATYSIPSGLERKGNLDPLAVPLIVPSQTPVVTQSAEVSARGLDDIAISLREDDDLWSRVDDAETSATAEARFKSSEATTELTLQIRPRESAGEVRTVIEQVWAQTWIADSTRQHRVVYCLRSNDRQLVVELPQESATQEIEVVLDNQRQFEFDRGEAQLIVSLPDSNHAERHTLELRYLEPSNFAVWDEMHVDLPQVGGSSDLADFYWSVVVPRNCWIVRGPSSLARGFDWSWSFAGLQPVSFRSTQELENETQAYARRPPGAGEAEYLFVGFGPGKAHSVHMVRSEILLFAIAAAALTAGLALLKTSLLRNPAILLAASMLIIVAGAAFPGAVIVAGPALAIGCLLVLLGGLLSLLAPRRDEIEATPSPSTYLGMQPTGSEKHLIGSAGAISTNAPTVSLSHSKSNA